MAHRNPHPTPLHKSAALADSPTLLETTPVFAAADIGKTVLDAVPLAKIGDMQRFYVPLSKRDDSQQMVWGIASTPALDSQNEVVDPDALRAALPAYMEWGAIREMHQSIAAGTAITAEFQGDELHLCAHIVDPLAWLKVQTGVYKGFSIGGTVLAAILVKGADGHEFRKITALDLIEISLVDRPANEQARILVFKANASPDDVLKEEATMPTELDAPAKTEAAADVNGFEAAQAFHAAAAKAAHGTIAPDDSGFSAAQEFHAAAVAAMRGEPIAKSDEAGTEALAKTAETDLTKAAQPDPAKMIAQLQQMRDAAEAEGDTETAASYTQAINALLSAAGKNKADDAPTPPAAADTDTDPANAGTAAANMHSAAESTDVEKAGAAISRGNFAALQAAHDNLAKVMGLQCAAMPQQNQPLMADDADGDDDMGMVAQPKTTKAAQPKAAAAQTGVPNDYVRVSVPPALDANALGDALAKSMGPAFTGLSKALEIQAQALTQINTRLSTLEQQPDPGPIGRALDRTMLGQMNKSAVPSVEASFDAVLDTITDPMAREAITKQKVLAMIKAQTQR